MRNLLTVGAFFVVLSWQGAIGASAQEGKELVGTPAPAWKLAEWFNSQPLSLEQLKGKVALVRWWTGPECPYCAASAPYLVQWDERYRRRGLIVVGIYHHKSPVPLTREHVGQLVERYGFRFPVAVDPDWWTLQQWWLKGRPQSWTSVSFLIDKRGIIRHVHPGGSYTEEEARAMESLIGKLLEEDVS
ncbi:MAG: alkyl hydroperoxide reductase [Candidatus Omnitrophica bacterium CG11_big_fil_rev_8_21_14_0_20_64_10]|nr:MAG: alkyl hydroperoxide reductase [Candidatus Omnitrophica bacterium CG11_big_fil_rev_8_21_14_0_20_64_10]